MSRPSVSDDVASRLHKWATQEMNYQHGHYSHQSLPNSNDFSQICKGEMSDIWHWVVNNVYSAQTVKKVQGNIMLKQRSVLPHTSVYKVKYGSDGHYNQEKVDLLEKRRALISKLRTTANDINHLQKDLHKTQSDLVAVEQQYSEKANSIRDLQRKAAILNTHSQHVQEEVDKIGEYKQRVDTRVKHLNETKSQDVERCYSRSSTSTESNPQPLETASTRCVRDACDLIHDFLQNMLQGTYGTQIETVRGAAKERLWVQVESAMGNYSANRVLLSLTICCQDSAYSLKERTTNINIKRDAEQLRFKYESSGQLSDLSSQSSVLKSVNQLLEESQNRQIERFMETERSRNTAWKLQSRLSQTQQLVNDHLTQAYKDSDPDVGKLAKAVFETELNIACTQITIRTLEIEADLLKEKNSLAMVEKERLYEKYQKIQDFKKMADNKQNLIRILVKQNLDARSKLENQQAEIVRYVEKSFSSHQTTTQTIAGQMKDSVSKEVESFSSLSMPNLLYTVLDSAYKITVADLSINRLSGDGNSASGKIIQRLLKSLEFPSYMAPEHLLSRVVELQCELADMRSAVEIHSSSVASQHASGYTESSLIQCLNDYVEAVKEHDQAQIEKLLPILQKRLTTITEALTNCLRVKDLVHEWWDQPCQYKTPWMKVDDLTYQQWKDKWTVAVTLLRRKQVQPS